MSRKKKSPRQPTTKELQKMTLKEIADLIKKTRDRLWPTGSKKKPKKGRMTNLWMQNWNHAGKRQ